MGGPWRCRGCTFFNEKFITDNALCEICQTSRKKRPASEPNDANSSVIDLCFSPVNKKRRVTMSNDTTSSVIDLCSSLDNKNRRVTISNDTTSSVIDVRSPDNEGKKNETRIFGGDPSNRMNTSAPMADDEKRKGGSRSKLNDTATSTENVSAVSTSTAAVTSRTKKNVSAASTSKATVTSHTKNVSAASTSKATVTSHTKNVSAATTSKATVTSRTKNVSAASTSKATVTSRNVSHPSSSKDDTIDKLNREGTAFYRNGQYNEAASTFTQALDIPSIDQKTRIILTNNLGKALAGINTNITLLDALTCLTSSIEQLSSQDEVQRRKYTLSRGEILAKLLRFDPCYLQQAIEDLEYVFRHAMATEDQKEKCIERLKIIVNTMKKLNPDTDAFPQSKGRWTPLEMECFDNALLVLGVDDLQQISPGKIARLIANSIPGRDYGSCDGHCRARHTSVAESKGKRKSNTTNQKTLDELRQIRVGWESLDSRHREIEIELARAKLELSKQRIHDDDKPIEPIVQAAIIAAREELQGGDDPEPLNLEITKPGVVLLSGYERHLNVEETLEVVLNDVDTAFVVRNAYDSIGFDIVERVVTLLLPMYQSISVSKKEEIRKLIVRRFIFVDITASGLSVLREIDALTKLRMQFMNRNSSLNLKSNRAFHDEVLVLGDAVVNSKRTLVTNDDSSPGQHELGQFVDRHAKEFNAENTTPERKKEIMQNACSLFDKMIRENEDGTYNLATNKKVRDYLRQRLIGSSADLIPNSQRKITEAGDDDVICTNSQGCHGHKNHPGNIDLSEVIDNNYLRARYSSVSKVAHEIYLDITERGGKVLYEKDGMLYECTTPRSIQLIAKRLYKKLGANPVKPGSTEDIFLKELKAIDVDETKKDQPPEQKNAWKFQAAKRAVQRKNSPYRICREYNAIRRIMSRYRQAEKKGIRKDEVSTLVGLETVHLIDWFDQGMPDDCDWEQYLEGKVHIDHRQSLQGQIQQFGEEYEERRWHFTNLWLLHGKKNSGKGGARGDNPDRKWNSEKKRWVETSDEDEKLVKEFINKLGHKSQIMKCSV